jgi:hypothetical protein
MRNLGRIIFVTAVLAVLFALIKYLAYGVSAEFGWGFAVGVGLMTPFAVLGMYLAEREAAAKVRAELSRPDFPSDL